MIALYLVIAFIVGYAFGNISFSRIFSRLFWKHDITKEGSHNPGTMNVLRTRGFGEALLTLCCDALKSGAPALGGYFLFEHFFAGYGHLAYILIGFGAIVGHCFPVIYKFKGGKGIACTFGMFLFHPVFWWGTLIVFACGFIVYFFIHYPFLVNLAAMLAMTIYATVYFSLKLQIESLLPILIILWVNMALLIFLCRGNFKRLREGTENKIDIVEKLREKRKKTDRSEQVPAASVESAEEEINQEEEKTEDDNK